MTAKPKLTFDEIGYWSEIKLDIVKEYATSYSMILSAQKNPSFEHIYIDAFAGAGIHISKATGDYIPGSPINALNVKPPFKQYHFIDLNYAKIESLRDIAGKRKDVIIHEGDCNSILLNEIFPKVSYKEYKRGLCLLDPYGLHLNWEVIKTAGQMKSIDVFLNFPVSDMNRNVLWKDPQGVDPDDIKRMNTFWGDDSWRNVAYSFQNNLFGFSEKEDNRTIVEGFSHRLREVAGFKNVADPLPMRNSNGAVIYYLFFASQKPVAANIIKDIFKKYKNRGV